ncbi:MAG: hypothetical protein ACJ73D_12500 [Pyrinomonadaceae bacterium]
MKKAIFAAVCALAFSAVALSQPRAPEKAQVASTAIEWQVRYEGGVFGASTKEPGTIKVSDTDQRVMFIRKSDGKEMFSIPYEALIVLFPDSKSEVSTTNKVISHMPLPGAGIAGMMSSSIKYANIQFDDPDIDAKGTASFRFEDKKELLSFLDSLGPRAKMLQRGDAYYRAKQKSVF